MLNKHEKKAIKKVEYKIASTRKELEGAYKLVYRSYLASNLTKAYRCPIRLSIFNALPETTTFIAKYNGEVIGTATMIIDTCMGLPMDKIYKKELDRFRKNSKQIAEISMLGTSHDFFVERAFSLLNAKKMVFLFKLFKLILDYALYKTRINDVCIAVHPKHAKLYQLLQFKGFGALKYYESVNKKPAQGFHQDLNKTKEWMSSKKDIMAASLYKIFFGTKTPDKVLNKKFEFSESDLKYFFVKKSDVFKNAGLQRINQIKKFYPDYDFNKIINSNEKI
jgi:hypothetical protein